MSDQKKCQMRARNGSSPLDQTASASPTVPQQVQAAAGLSRQSGEQHGFYGPVSIELAGEIHVRNMRRNANQRDQMICHVYYGKDRDNRRAKAMYRTKFREA
jgi:hypothetical protein